MLLSNGRSSFKPYYRLSENLHLTLDRRFCLLVPLVCRETHIPNELINLVNALQDIAEVSYGILKRQKWPPLAPDS